MLKKLVCLLALCLALTLCFPALAEEEQAAVLATFDGEEITLEEVQAILDDMVSQDYAEPGDYALALEYIIVTQVKEAKIKELGLDELTAEEEEALRAEAHEMWENALDNYVSYYLTDDTEESRNELRETAIAYYTSQGLDEEYVVEYLKWSAPYDKLEKYVMELSDVSVTEEEIRESFEAAAADEGAYLKDNVPTYEIYQMYGASFWYVPEGYRGIIHILLSVDEELMAAYEDAQATYEESVTDEAPEGDAALKAARDQAYDAVIASKQDTIDEIYARLEKGESFSDLIAQYGQDPGMQNADRLASGYEVHEQSIIYDPAFIAAAFSDKMQKPGDVSDPVVGTSGIHILYYLRDIPGGIVEMTEEIRAEIEESLLTEKKSTASSEALEAWYAEHEIVRNQELLDSLSVPAEGAGEE